MTDTPMSRRGALRLGGLVLPAVAAPALLTGCGSEPATAKGRVLRLSQTADTATLDPQKQGDMLSMNVLINIFDTLTTRSAAGKLVPRLAVDWHPRSEHTWRFRLRKGVRFHNGEPFDARAVKFSIERLLDPKTRSPIVELRYVKDVQVVDAHTVDVRTTEHDPIIPEKLSLFGGVMLPPRYLEEKGDAGFARQPVGTGPFRFVSWQRDHELKLRAYADHWNGRPGPDGLVFKPIPNPASALAALQSDEIDLVTGLTPDQARQLAGYTDVHIVSRPGIRTSYLSLDTLAGGPLADRRVRRAVNHAVDVPLLVKAVLDGKAREVPAMIPKGVFGHDPDIKPFTRSLSAARRLLTEAGHPDGIETTLTASNDDANTAEAISGLLARAGIRAHVELLDPGTYSARLTSDNRHALGPMYLAASTIWTMDGSSSLQSNVRHERRQSRWHSKEADRLVDAEELSLKPSERQRAFTALQRLIKEEAPFVPLYQVDTIVARNGRTRWRPTMTGSLAMESAVITS